MSKFKPPPASKFTHRRINRFAKRYIWLINSGKYPGTENMLCRYMGVQRFRKW